MLTLTVLVLAVSVIVAKLRGGNLKDDFGLKHIWLAPAAFGMQLANYFSALPYVVQVSITVVTYGMLLYFTVVNIGNPGIRVILFGMILNIAVMMTNGGRMPVDIDKAREIGVPDIEAVANGSASKWGPLTVESRLPFLADVIPLPAPLRKMISAGDIFTLLGGFLLVQDLMGRRIVILRSEETQG